MPQYGKLKIDQFLYNDSGTDVTLNLADLVTTGANTFTGNQSLGDNLKVQLGASNDLQIFHNGSYSFIKDTGTGGLVVNTDALYVKNAGDSEALAYFIENGAVELYYDNAKKLETYSQGVKIPARLMCDSGWANYSAKIGRNANEGLFLHSDAGSTHYNWRITTQTTVDEGFEIAASTAVGGETFATPSLVIKRNGEVRVPDNGKFIAGTGSDLQIYHDGSNSKISDVGTGDLQLLGANVGIYSTGGEPMFVGIANGASELYYDNSKKLETTSTGGLLQYQWKFNDGSGAGGSNKLTFGTHDDLGIYHDGSNSYIKHYGTGSLIMHAADSGEDIYIRAADDVFIQTQTSDYSIKAWGNGAVELYYDNAKKFETSSTGVTINGAAIVGGNLELNSDAYLKIGASNDLQIFHDGTHNYIQSTNGRTHLIGVGRVQIQTNNGSTTENSIVAYSDGAVHLYYNNGVKLETTSTGINVTGAITVNGAALSGGASYASLLRYF